MKPAILWLNIFAIGFSIITAMMIVTFFTPIPYGDLTRIGRLSEHEFGWQLPPPPLRDEELIGVSADQADIIVFGDSFSMTKVWQAELVRVGYRISTVYWPQFDSKMCGDFEEWLKNAGFQGKLVIIESIERLFYERMEKTEKCAQGKMSPPYPVKQFTSPPLKKIPDFAINRSAKLTTGLITFRNTWKAKNSNTDIIIDKNVKVQKVPDGCLLFSHRTCDRSLFFIDDDTTNELTFKTVEKMQKFTQAHQSIHLLWAIIPNKTTVYLNPERSSSFVNALNATNLGPDLFTLLRDQRMKTRDLYFPNDTHLSMHGQIVLGRRMLEAVREVLPRPPNHSP